MIDRGRTMPRVTPQPHITSCFSRPNRGARVLKIMWSDQFQEPTLFKRCLQVARKSRGGEKSCRFTFLINFYRLKSRGIFGGGLLTYFLFGHTIDPQKEAFLHARKMVNQRYEK
jgi:hypothetical protein